MRNLLLLFGILFSIPTFGQENTYIGIEAGLPFEVYQAVDNGNGIYTKPFFSEPMFGITVGQELKQNFIIETGVYRKRYSESFYFRNHLTYGISNAIVAWQIPFRLKSSINLVKDKVSITGVIGYAYSINSSFGSSGWGSGSTVSNTNTVTYTDTINHSLRKTFSLLETGAAIEFKIVKTVLLTISSSYYTGFSKIVNMDITYTINNEPTNTATVFTNGDYFNFMVGLKLPISKLWIKRNENTGNTG